MYRRLWTVPSLLRTGGFISIYIGRNFITIEQGGTPIIIPATVRTLHVRKGTMGTVAKGRRVIMSFGLSLYYNEDLKRKYGGHPSPSTPFLIQLHDTTLRYLVQGIQLGYGGGFIRTEGHQGPLSHSKGDRVQDYRLHRTPDADNIPRGRLSSLRTIAKEYDFRIYTISDSIGYDINLMTALDATNINEANDGQGLHAHIFGTKFTQGGLSLMFLRIHVDERQRHECVGNLRLKGLTLIQTNGHRGQGDNVRHSLHNGDYNFITCIITGLGECNFLTITDNRHSHLELCGHYPYDFNFHYHAYRTPGLRLMTNHCTIHRTSHDHC